MVNKSNTYMKVVNNSNTHMKVVNVGLNAPYRTMYYFMLI